VRIPVRGAWCVVFAAALSPAWVAGQQSARTLEFSGLVLVNGFYNNTRVNNSDVPVFAVFPAPTDSLPQGSVGGTMRQTRFGALLTDPNVLGGTFTGELDVDFYGGQLGNAGRTFPLLRVRRLVGRLNWARSEVLFGQEGPLVSDLNPRSLASVGVPGFTAAGNLWFWMPQVRAGGELDVGRGIRAGLQGAVIAPMTGDPQGTFNTQPDLAERSGRPFLQGRVRVSWGPSDDASEIGVGAHQGWFATKGDSLLASQAVVVSGRIKVSIVELRGERFTGRGLAALGAGGIGTNFDSTGATLSGNGGWVQVNLRPREVIEVGGGCGQDRPRWDAAGAASGASRVKNFVCEGHAIWRPAGPLVVGFEYRHMETTYGGTAGTAVARHVNVQAGYRF
jgi:hypothetical protein